MQQGQIIFWAVAAIFLNNVPSALGSCRFSSPEWKTARTGPRMSQPNPSDPTRVRLDWGDLVKKPECADGFRVYVWKDVAGRPSSFLTPDRILGPLPTNATSYVVDNIDPCTPFGFLVEMEVKPAMSRAFKIKSGKSNYQTRGIASVVSSDPNNVRVEYLYRNQTNDFDLTRAVVKFNKNAVVKNPDCLSSIKLDIKQLPPSYNIRHKRTIGKLYESPTRTTSNSSYSSSYSSYSSSSYSSSSSRGGRGRSSTSRTSNEYTLSTSSQEFSPPFVATETGGNDVELVVRVKPCVEYILTMTFIGQRSAQVGKVDNIRMKSLSEIPNFRLPPITDVLSTTPLGLSRTSPIPATCLDTYFRAVNQKLLAANCEDGNRGPNIPTPRPDFSTSTDLPGVVVENPILKQHGCICKNTSMVNFTSTDSKILSKHKVTLGAYKFSGRLHEGKPYYVKGRPNEEVYVYWYPKSNEWFISDFLGSISPILKLGKNANTSCPENPTSAKWQRKGMFGSWSKDNTARMTCDAVAKKAVPSDVISQCQCKAGVKLESAILGSRSPLDKKEARGTYRFESKLYQGKPYYVKRNQGTALYMFFFGGTWNIAKQLGSTSLLFKMEKNAAGNCPESSMKKWQVKNAIGMWKKDPSISMTCAEERAVTPRPSFTTTTPARRPSYTTTRPTQRPSYGTTRRPTYGTTTPTPRPSHMGTTPSSSLAMLKNAGCRCHTTPLLTVTSTDSRTKSKHSDQLGEYRFADQLHNGRPFYKNRNNYVMYFDKTDISWQVASKAEFDKAHAAGGKCKKPTMSTQDGTDQKCPGDPTTSQSKPWTRKNAWGIWGRDKTMVVKCGAGVAG